MIKIIEQIIKSIEIITKLRIEDGIKVDGKYGNGKLLCKFGFNLTSLFYLFLPKEIKVDGWRIRIFVAQSTIESYNSNIYIKVTYRKLI